MASSADPNYTGPLGAVWSVSSLLRYVSPSMQSGVSLFTGPSELDQASSGFEDCSSLIRPKASEDSTHTTAAPSLAESMRTHKPQSIPDSLQTSKPPSVLDDVKTYKAPSISSTGSNKSSGML